MNTRRYHGLLTTATKPPVGRVLLLAKFEETLILAGQRYDLSVNRYPGVVHPQGHRFLKEFRLDPFPVYTYEVDGVEIEKRVFMVQGENTTVVEYQLRGSVPDCLLEIRTLIAFRDYHATTHRNDGLNPAVAWQREGFAPKGIPAHALALGNKLCCACRNVGGTPDHGSPRLQSSDP